MNELQLSFVLRLEAGEVKYRIERIGIGGLHAAIHAEVDEQLVVVAEVMVHACRLSTIRAFAGTVEL